MRFLLREKVPFDEGFPQITDIQIEVVKHGDMPDYAYPHDGRRVGRGYQT